MLNEKQGHAEPHPTTGENMYPNVNPNHESTNIPGMCFGEWLLIRRLFGGSMTSWSHHDAHVLITKDA